MKKRKVTQTSQIIVKDNGRMVIHLDPTDICPVRKALADILADEIYKAAAQQFNDGGKIKLKQIADKFGCTYQNISQTLEKRGVVFTRTIQFDGNGKAV